MRRAVAILALALALPAVARADPSQPGIVHVPRPPGASLEQWGGSVFAANCLKCHGPGGQGTDRGPSLRGVGALSADFYLTTGYMPLESPDDQPHRSTQLLTSREVDALIAYVASLGPGPAIPHPRPERGSVAEGMQLFTQHCAGCHQVVGEGGYVKGARVPALAHATPKQIAEAVRIGPYLMPHFSTKAISDRELDSIIAYVQYAKHPDDAGGWALGHVGPVPEGLVTWLIAGVVLVALCVVIGVRMRRT